MPKKKAKATARKEQPTPARKRAKPSKKPRPSWDYDYKAYAIGGRGGQPKGRLLVTPEGRRFILERKGFLKAAFGGSRNGLNIANPFEKRSGAVIKRVERYTEHHAGEFLAMVQQRKISNHVAMPIARMSIAHNTYNIVLHVPPDYSSARAARDKLSTKEKRSLFARIRTEYKKLLEANLLPMDLRPENIMVGRDPRGKPNFLFIDTSPVPLSANQIRILLSRIGQASLSGLMNRYLERRVGTVQFTNIEAMDEAYNNAAIDWARRSVPNNLMRAMAEDYFNWAMEELKREWGV